MKKYNEEVLVIPSEKFKRIHRDSLTPEELFNECSNDFMYLDRNIAEVEPDYVQIIPYISITCGSKVFQYTRINKSNEKRLLNRSSVGVGGHISSSMDLDIGSPDLIEKASRIEIQEEICIKSRGKEITNYDIEFFDTHFNTSTEVGRLHIGIFGTVNLSDLSEVTIEVRETDKIEGNLVSIFDIDYDNLEDWSKELYSNFLPVLHLNLLGSSDSSNKFVILNHASIENNLYFLYRSINSSKHYIIKHSDSDVMCYEAEDNAINIIFNNE